MERGFFNPHAVRAAYRILKTHSLGTLQERRGVSVIRVNTVLCGILRRYTVYGMSMQ